MTKSNVTRKDKSQRIQSVAVGFAPQTVRGLLLGTVSAIALSAALGSLTEPSRKGAFTAPEFQHPTTTTVSSTDSTMRNQTDETGQDEPPNPAGHSPLLTHFAGYPDKIEGWTAKYFQPWEFASKGNGKILIDARLVTQLDAVREDLGLPIRITSGYRDPAYNTRVGGAKNSQHMHGTAVDIDISSYDTATRYRLVMLLVEHGFTSFGSYENSPSMLHADIRKRAAKWHHGAGTHPDWFSQALNDIGWKRGATADEMMQLITAEMVSHEKTTKAVDKVHAGSSVMVTATRYFDGPIKFEGLYETTNPNGWNGGVNLAYETGSDNIAVGATVKYKREGSSDEISAAHNSNGAEFKFSVERSF